MANKQFGALVSNTKEEVVLAVGRHRPIFSWKGDRNQITSISIYESAHVAELLQSAHLLTAGTTYGKSPWES